MEEKEWRKIAIAIYSQIETLEESVKFTIKEKQKYQLPDRNLGNGVTKSLPQKPIQEYHYDATQGSAVTTDYGVVRIVPYYGDYNMLLKEAQNHFADKIPQIRTLNPMEIEPDQANYNLEILLHRISQLKNIIRTYMGQYEGMGV